MSPFCYKAQYRAGYQDPLLPRNYENRTVELGLTRGPGSGPGSEEEEEDSNKRMGALYPADLSKPRGLFTIDSILSRPAVNTNSSTQQIDNSLPSHSSISHPLHFGHLAAAAAAAAGVFPPAHDFLGKLHFQIISSHHSKNICMQTKIKISQSFSFYSNQFKFKIYRKIRLWS
ncbi:hypothetical protein O3M35_007863 [Rhynocoris fuscipes]|uniref:Uncharacterized protein n=1 Tax=Rhynocoris fuscipes TaxID=488301 RepID=A0AAW1DI60_9HEMI